MTVKKLTKGQVLHLNEAIKAIEGRLEEAKDENGKVLGLLSKPYDIDSKAVYALARTKNKIEPIVHAIDRQRRILISNALKVKEYPQVDLEEDVSLVLEEEIDVDIFEFPIADLKIATNKLSPTLVASLLCVTTGEL